MKSCYATLPAKTAKELVEGLENLSDRPQGEEIEVRSVVTVGQTAVVVYLLYRGGELQ